MKLIPGTKVKLLNYEFLKAYTIIYLGRIREFNEYEATHKFRISANQIYSFNDAAFKSLHIKRIYNRLAIL